MNTKSSTMITTLLVFFLTLFSLFAPSVALPAPAPGALANAPASLMGRTYSYIAREDALVVRAPGTEKPARREDFDEDPLTEAIKYMLKAKSRRS